ncbi:NAD(P)/FAD-dependent oxidoreductase, partial [candidate division WOR-3 bacterium]|nr:NAD(P)/FAD-dependent oxidoreductase [candidate division WOR-3 bacterium]
MDINDVVIIGGGPAGLSTAIQLKRSGIEPILLEKDEIGGLLRNANLVENYPGFPEGITGPQLIKLFEKQLKNTMVKVHFEEVLELDYRNEVFFVNTNQRVVTCHIVVIASGTKPRRLSDINMSKDSEDRIFYEIYALTQVAKEKIAIIGSGDIAFDYALNLSKKNGVIILNKGQRVKCLPLLWKKAMESEKITYKENTQVKKI